ncbi:hypothetical protein AB3K25_03590 [Leuconostoc sp. MS02]|uniref:Uncharacterized protein n=1 Tax=Leuconostoc aquikimchii TaxID=3236804 RepID=A0ABV3S3I2_9LACO
MIKNVNSNSYATISFSSDIGISVDNLNTDEYYVLGPQNNGLKSNTFVSHISDRVEKSVLPSTGVLSGANSLYVTAFSIIIVIGFLYTLHHCHHKMVGQKK